MSLTSRLSKFSFRLTYVGKHFSHGGLHHPLAIVGLHTAGIVGDEVVVDAASVRSNPILGILVLKKFGLVHLP